MQMKITSAEQFVQLRSSDNPDEYLYATKAEASEDIWIEIIHNYPSFARWVAHNKTIPVSVVRILSQSEDSDVRSFIAAKRKTPADVLVTLAKDEDEGVRRRIVYNPKTPEAALLILKEDGNREIRDKALERLGGN